MKKRSSLYAVTGATVLSITAFTVIALPAYAATSGYCAGVGGQIFAAGTTIGGLIKYATCFIQDLIIPLLFTLALAVFIWGMVKFIMSQQSAEKEDGKQFMLWGVIALAVMFSVWGLVNIFQETFGVKNAIPQLTVPR